MTTPRQRPLSPDDRRALWTRLVADDNARPADQRRGAVAVLMDQADQETAEETADLREAKGSADAHAITYGRELDRQARALAIIAPLVINDPSPLAQKIREALATPAGPRPWPKPTRPWPKPSQAAA